MQQYKQSHVNLLLIVRVQAMTCRLDTTENRTALCSERAFILLFPCPKYCIYYCCSRPLLVPILTTCEAKSRIFSASGGACSGVPHQPGGHLARGWRRSRAAHAAIKMVERVSLRSTIYHLNDWTDHFTAPVFFPMYLSFILFY